MTITIGIGRSSRIRRAASIPSSFGIFTSSSARSGSSLRASATASSPSLRLGDDLEAALLEQLPQVEPDDRLVFRDQNPHVVLSSGRESHVGTQAGLAEELERSAELVTDERADDGEPGSVGGVLHALAVVGDGENGVAPRHAQE